MNNDSIDQKVTGHRNTVTGEGVRAYIYDSTHKTYLYNGEKVELNKVQNDLMKQGISYEIRYKKEESQEPAKIKLDSPYFF